MFVAIRSFEVQNGFEDHVNQACKERPELVEVHSDLVRLETLSAANNPTEISHVTHGKTEAGFKDWYNNHQKKSHPGIPKALKLVPHSNRLLFIEQIGT